MFQVLLVVAAQDTDEEVHLNDGDTQSYHIEERVDEGVVSGGSWVFRLQGTITLNEDGIHIFQLIKVEVT